MNQSQLCNPDPDANCKEHRRTAGGAHTEMRNGASSSERGGVGGSSEEAMYGKHAHDAEEQGRAMAHDDMQSAASSGGKQKRWPVSNARGIPTDTAEMIGRGADLEEQWPERAAMVEGDLAESGSVDNEAVLISEQSWASGAESPKRPRVSSKQDRVEGVQAVTAGQSEQLVDLMVRPLAMFGSLTPIIPLPLPWLTTPWLRSLHPMAPNPTPWPRNLPHGPGPAAWPWPCR